MSFSSIHTLLNEKLYFLSHIVSNVVLVDTTSLWCSAVGLNCGARGVSGLPCLLNLREQLQLITLWIPTMLIVIYFLPLRAGPGSGCTVCITLHDLHSASFDYRRQKEI